MYVRKRCQLLIALALSAACARTQPTANDVPLPPGLPPAPASGPALCPGNFLTPEQGKAALDFTIAHCPDRQTWEARAAHERQCILRGLELEPLPKRTPLNPIVRDRRTHLGYCIENVAFSPIPGYYVTGNLYRPLDAKPPYAVILSTHGHGADHGRCDATVQMRCGMLARMGAIVFAIDMFGFGESVPQIAKAHQNPLAGTMQLWDNLRAVDFLLAQDGADPRRVGVTGESGGGTQSFLLTALDPRIAVSVPVVMVSSYFFGGCPCESGRPIHRSAEHFVTNAEIAALAAPRPQLVVSDGKDWTQHVPLVEFPFLQRIYGLYGRAGEVANAHFADERHDYGPSKRAAMYAFMVQRLGLDPTAVRKPDGGFDESAIALEKPADLHVFTAAHPQPADALGSLDAIERALKALQ